MSSSTMGIAGFLLIVYAIGIFIAYHKIFAVIYFNKIKGIGQEIMWSLIGSVLLTALTIYLYWVVAIIVALAGLILSLKIEEKEKRITVIVIFLILAVVIFFVGRNMKNEVSGDQDSPSSEYLDDEQDEEYFDDDANSYYYEEESNDSEDYGSDISYENGTTVSGNDEEQEALYGDDLSDGESAYIIANSNTVELTEADLETLSPQELTYARNEIYARYGYIFQSQELNDYFSSKSWYEPNASEDGSSLSLVEQENARKIRAYQEEHGLEYTPE